MTDRRKAIIFNTALQISDFEREPAHAFLEALRLHAELAIFQQQFSDTINKADSTAESLKFFLTEMKVFASSVCDSYLVRMQNETEKYLLDNNKVIEQKDRQIAQLVGHIKVQNKKIDQLIELLSRRRSNYFDRMLNRLSNLVSG